MTTLVDVSLWVQETVRNFFAGSAWNDKTDWGVYYGDQAKLPKRVTVCIEPNTKQTTLKNAQRGVTREFEVFVLVYYTSLNQPGQLNRVDADMIAEELEEHLNANPQMDGKVVHCMVTEVASGYSTKDGTIVKSSRLTFSGMTTDRLPS